LIQKVKQITVLSEDWKDRIWLRYGTLPGCPKFRTSSKCPIRDKEKIGVWVVIEIGLAWFTLTLELKKFTKLTLKKVGGC